MNTQKHTQGPFNITTNTTPGQFGTETKIRDAQNSVIAVLHVNIEGNGPLLCAAPDLLAALKSMVCLYEVMHARNPYTDSRPLQALAAIAKAEGVK